MLALTPGCGRRRTSASNRRRRRAPSRAAPPRLPRPARTGRRSPRGWTPCRRRPAPGEASPRSPVTTMHSAGVRELSTIPTMASSALLPDASRTERDPRVAPRPPPAPSKNNIARARLLRRRSASSATSAWRSSVRGPRGPADEPDQVVAVEEVRHHAGRARRGCLRRKKSTARARRHPAAVGDEQDEQRAHEDRGEPRNEEHQGSESDGEDILRERDGHLRDAARGGGRRQPGRGLGEVGGQRRERARRRQADPGRRSTRRDGREHQQSPDDRPQQRLRPGSTGGRRSGSCPPRTPPGRGRGSP